MTDHVIASTDGAVTTLRLDRPEKKNALTRAMYGALADGLLAAAADAQVHAVLLAGGADFTAGNDLADFAAQGGQEGSSAAFRFLEVLVGFPKPLVAAVRGNAIGIGTTLLLHCDGVVASATARLQMPFTRLALVPEAASSLLLADGIGRAQANWLLLSGEPLTGAEAAAQGLVTRAVADDAVDATAATMAAQLAALPPGAMAETKRLLRAPAREAVQATLLRERESFQARLKTTEAQAAFAAFLNRAK